MFHHVVIKSLEQKLSGIALSMSKFSSATPSKIIFCSGVNIRGAHLELTYEILKIVWVIVRTLVIEI